MGMVLVRFQGGLSGGHYLPATQRATGAWGQSICCLRLAANVVGVVEFRCANVAEKPLGRPVVGHPLLGLRGLDFACRMSSVFTSIVTGVGVVVDSLSGILVVLGSGGHVFLARLLRGVGNGVGLYEV